MLVAWYKLVTWKTFSSNMQKRISSYRKLNLWGSPTDREAFQISTHTARKKKNRGVKTLYFLCNLILPSYTLWEAGAMNISNQGICPVTANPVLPHLAGRGEAEPRQNLTYHFEEAALSFEHHTCSWHFAYNRNTSAATKVVGHGSGM